MDAAMLCQHCLRLEKELADCRILAKAVEYELEAEINENSQLKTWVEILSNVSQGPSTATAQQRMQETLEHVSAQMLHDKGAS